MQQRRGPGRHILGGPRPRSPIEELQGFHIDSEDPLVGKTIHNKYKITRKIGGGGMGTIYRAIDQTGSVVALKVIGADMTTKEDMRARFMLEAEAATVVNHPNVIEVTEIGTFSNRVFCVMEYLEGQDLSKLLRKDKRLGWDQFKPLMLQICSGVAAAHDCKIIHRDLKPANIFLIDKGGRDFVKVLDFGLAKFRDSKEEGITLSGTFLGTTSYAAPEQARGLKDLDNRVDIYALGIIMYEMLTGKVPFKGETPIATLQMHINDVPRRPTELNPSIPADVEAVIMKALQKKREDRFQSVAEMRDAITRCRTTNSLHGTRKPDHVPIERMVENRPQSRGSNTFTPAITNEPLVEPERNTSQAKSQGSPGRFARYAALTSVLAVAGAGYLYRDNISRLVSSFQTIQAATEGPTPPAPVLPPTQTSGYNLSIRVMPVGAQVFEMARGSQRGRYLGATPLDVHVEDGSHNIVIRKSGFSPRTFTVTSENRNIRGELGRTAVRRPTAEQPEPPTTEVPIEENEGDQ